MPDNGSFGRWLKARRKALDLTQDELARQTGCTISTIAKIESGARRPSKQIAARLLQVLHIPAAESATLLHWARAGGAIDRAARQQTLAGTTAHHERQRADLPAAPTPLIGREQDLATLRHWLCQDNLRLLTLTGAPGVGKTRLGLALADALRSTFADGVCFVALAAIRDSSLVDSTIAQALGLPETGRQPATALLIEALAHRQILLVLDNFEHQQAAGLVVAQLLAACPALRVLVTSRVPLGLRSERQFVVQPLALPDQSHSVAYETIAQSPAVALFVDRAQAVHSGFALTAANAEDVVAICARLDGLPLAIELVTGRLKALAPRDLLERLERRLPLLTGGPSDMLPHHQALRTAIDWSFELLCAAEQTLFAWLAVFVGGCTLHAALAIGTGPADTDVAMLDRLTSLVTKNLLCRYLQPDGTARFTMLETIREYAQEQLLARGDSATIGRWHATYYLTLAETAEQEAQGAQQVAWLKRLEIEHDNLRAAIRWALDQDELELAARLSGALAWFWNVHGHRQEGRRWLDRALARRALLPLALQAKALDGVGLLAANQSDFVSAQAAYDASLHYYRQIDDRRGLARVLEHLGWVAMFQDQAGRAASLLEESLSLHQAYGDPAGQAVVLNHLGLLALFQSDHARAAQHFEASLAWCRAIDDTGGIARLHNHLGLLALVQSDHPRAIRHFEEGLKLQRACGNIGDSAHLLNHLGKVALLQGDPARAHHYFVESLAAFQTLDDRQGIAWSLAGLGGVAALGGQAVRAARLLSAAAALRDRIGAPVPVAGRALYAQVMAVAQSQLDEATWTTVWALGHTMTLEQAIADALAQ